MEDQNLDEMEQTAQETITRKNAVEERMKNLTADKVAAEKKAQDETQARQTVEKERDFYSGFADSITKYPNAGEFKDSIKEKVLAGYSVEDATVSVLAREGKLNASPIQRDNPAGGSASNQIQGTSNKTVAEMNREERRAAIMDSQNRGDISLS